MKNLKLKKIKFLKILKLLNNIIYKSENLIIEIKSCFIIFKYINRFIKISYYYKKKNNSIKKKFILNITNLIRILKTINLKILKFIIKKKFLKLKDNKNLFYRINKNIFNKNNWKNNKIFKIRKKNNIKKFAINVKKIVILLKFLSNINNKNFNFKKKNLLLIISNKQLKFLLIENTHLIWYRIELKNFFCSETLVVENSAYLLKILNSLIFNFAKKINYLIFKLINNKFILIRYKHLKLIYKLDLNKNHFIVLKKIKKTYKNYLFINSLVLKEAIVKLLKISTSNIFKFVLKKNILILKINNNLDIFKKILKTYYNGGRLSFKLKGEVLLNFLKNINSKNLIMHFSNKFIVLTSPNLKNLKFYISILKLNN